MALSPMLFVVVLAVAAISADAAGHLSNKPMINVFTNASKDCSATAAPALAFDGLYKATPKTAAEMTTCMAGTLRPDSQNVTTKMGCDSTKNGAVVVNYWVKNTCTGNATGYMKLTPTNANILRSGGCANGIAETGDQRYVKISNLDVSLMAFCLPTTTTAAPKKASTSSAFQITGSVAGFAVLLSYLI